MVSKRVAEYHFCVKLCLVVSAFTSYSFCILKKSVYWRLEQYFNSKHNTDKKDEFN